MRPTGPTASTSPTGNLIALKQGLSEQQLKVLELELNRRRKSTPVAYLLWFFLSMFGLHKFYLGKAMSGVLYIAGPWLAVIFLVTGTMVSHFSGGAYAILGGSIAALGVFALVAYGIWWFVDLFTLHWQVERCNEEIEARIIGDIRRTAP